MPNDSLARLEKHSDELSFSEIFYILRKSWIVIFFWAMAGALVGAVHCYMETPLYTARATIVAASFDETPSVPSSSFSSFLRLPSSDVALTKLRTVLASQEFAQQLIERHHVDALLNLSSSASSPLLQRSFFDFLKIPPPGPVSPSVKVLNQLQRVEVEELSGTMATRLSFEHADPDVAAQFLAVVLDEADSYLRADRIRQLKQEISYLNGRMAETREQSIRLALYKEIIDRELKLVDASTRKNFAARIIGPPLASSSPTHPKPVLILSISLVLGMFMGVLTAFFRTYIRSQW